MVPARTGEPPFEFPRDVLGQLAEMERERWVREKLAAGWSYAPETDKPRRLHNCLVPWDRLAEVEKEKDRAAVRKISTILAHAGYTVVAARSYSRISGSTSAESERNAPGSAAPIASPTVRSCPAST